MPYVKDAAGIIYPKYGLCAECGGKGVFLHTVRVASKSDKPLAVYLCADAVDRNKR